jgi:(S)-sulfolactate dehydrogenase
MVDIVVTEFMDEAALSRIGLKHRVHYDPGLADRQREIASMLGDCLALVVRNRTQVGPELLKAAPKLQCIGRLGVGLDNIDLEAAKSRGIAVYPATGANDVAVAEYVIATAMILLRGAYGSTGDVTSGHWPRQRLIGRELSGKCLGLVGYGSIARKTAMRAAALGMEVVAFDPFLPLDSPSWAGAKPVGFDNLLAAADVVSLHVPLDASTRHMIDSAAFARLRTGAVLINAARGGIVDEAALAAALRSGHLGGAAIDVFEEEPLSASSGARFAGIGNIILTPHIAGVTIESNIRVSDAIADKVLRHLEGKA